MIATEPKETVDISDNDKSLSANSNISSGKDRDFAISAADVLKKNESDFEKGLTDSQVTERLERYGKNMLEASEKISVWKILWHNINNIIVYLLFFSAAVSFVMHDIIEGAAILIALLLSVIVGFVSEYKSQKSVESLKKMITTSAKVVRNGNTQEIDSADVVPGDILYLEEGDLITADARLVQTNNLATVESALTGESESVGKDENLILEENSLLADRKNMVYSGTAVARGNGYAVVTATGMSTEIGRIAGLLNKNVNEATPLEKQLDKLGKILIVFSGICGVLVIVFGLIFGYPLMQMVQMGIILAIAAIPESMPAVSTITLVLGMSRMAKKKALVKSLPAVETLGATTVICTDKTGTLTENQMTVRGIYLASGVHYKVEGKGYEPIGKILHDDIEANVKQNKELHDFIQAAVLCSNATLRKTENDHTVVGDPTDGAMIVLGAKTGLEREKFFETGFKELYEIPFNSDDKYMVSLNVRPDGGKDIYVKGAPEVVLSMSEKAAVGALPRDHEESDLRIESELDSDLLEKFEKANESYASEGMRIIAVAALWNYTGGDSEDEIRAALKHNLSFLGFAAIMDPPREDVKEAVKIAQEAGIRIMMITGDNPRTAQSIAKQIGIQNCDKALTGYDLDKMSQEDLEKDACMAGVLARVSPDHKLQLVKAIKTKDEVVAMTGDGVNDAPALSGSDIGIAMGIRGTEVAKEAADMILTDDRFYTIVEAVKEGRIIFDNIKKFILYLFACNIVEIVAVVCSIFMHLGMPVAPLQILWLNLVVDVLPAMALAWEPGEGNVMKNRPRGKDEGLISKNFLSFILFSGTVIGLGAFGAYWYMHTHIASGLSAEQGEFTAQTVAFMVMALGQLFHVLNARKKYGIGIDGTIFKNPVLIWGWLISLGVQLAAIYMPVLNKVMKTVPLYGWLEWQVILIATLIPAIIVAIYKKLFYK